HLMFRDPGISLNHSVMDSQYKFVTSSMEGGVRSAGAAEYAGLDAAPDYRRAEIFKALASGLFPNLNTDSSEAWMGSRSSTPDSLPYIGQVSGYVGLFCAFGHGHLGLTGAPETGRLVAALANGENPDIDLEPYSLARFKG
ncbi:MAG: FAD-dependent oxidoreductase, partial [Gammaproteobacteria bacterium]|nr:FAD-dependent oxidoreductase [Gammaproteobacteria bacterium]